jgi:ribA/ribD-fused uncharacterized protein
MRVTDTHVYFWGSFLSNFYYAPFKVILNDEEMTFLTSEHYYMYMKARRFNDEESAHNILAAPEAKIAKAFGRGVKNFDSDIWDEVAVGVMTKACTHKFTQNIIIRERLIETGDRILVEASPVDFIWGVGLHESDDRILDENNWKGLNRLGSVLMNVRDKMKEL